MNCPDCYTELNSRYKCPKCDRQWDYVYLDGYWDGYEKAHIEINLNKYIPIDTLKDFILEKCDEGLHSREIIGEIMKIINKAKDKK